MSGARSTLVLPNAAKFVVIESATDTGGERVEFEVTLPSGPSGPPSHVPPHQEESWRVLEGELTLTVDSHRETLRSGQKRAIPPGSVHTFADLGGTAVRFRDCHTPALDFQQYIDTLAWLFAAGRLTSRPTAATLIYGAIVLRRRRTTQLSAKAGQQAAESLLALVDRVLGWQIAGDATADTPRRTPDRGGADEPSCLASRSVVSGVMRGRD